MEAGELDTAELEFIGVLRREKSIGSEARRRKFIRTILVLKYSAIVTNQLELWTFVAKNKICLWDRRVATT
jgi:hypothetical protein